MKKEYTEISEFLDDVHNTLSLKEECERRKSLSLLFLLTIKINRLLCRW